MLAKTLLEVYVFLCRLSKKGGGRVSGGGYRISSRGGGGRGVIYKGRRVLIELLYVCVT